MCRFYGTPSRKRIHADFIGHAHAILSCIIGKASNHREWLGNLPCSSEEEQWLLSCQAYL